MSIPPILAKNLDFSETTASITGALQRRLGFRQFNLYTIYQLREHFPSLTTETNIAERSKLSFIKVDFY